MRSYKEWIMIGSGNGFAAIPCQAITWYNHAYINQWSGAH